MLDSFLTNLSLTEYCATVSAEVARQQTNQQQCARGVLHGSQSRMLQGKCVKIHLGPIRLTSSSGPSAISRMAGVVPYPDKTLSAALVWGTWRGTGSEFVYPPQS